MHPTPTPFPVPYYTPLQPTPQSPHPTHPRLVDDVAIGIGDCAVDEGGVPLLISKMTARELRAEVRAPPFEPVLTLAAAPRRAAPSAPSPPHQRRRATVPPKNRPPPRPRRRTLKPRPPPHHASPSKTKQHLPHPKTKQTTGHGPPHGLWPLRHRRRRRKAVGARGGAQGGAFGFWTLEGLGRAGKGPCLSVEAPPRPGNAPETQTPLPSRGRCAKPVHATPKCRPKLKATKQQTKPPGRARRAAICGPEPHEGPRGSAQARARRGARRQGPGKRQGSAAGDD